ncbi:hypothetical protein K492DRAFT_241264 [Lichtheimia hyalospora FSU 10163]|nr:hypothetical protein K492DRAFT_241264 [Lichtheimia hyalospora FSU 10163]
MSIAKPDRSSRSRRNVLRQQLQKTTNQLKRLEKAIAPTLKHQERIHKTKMRLERLEREMQDIRNKVKKQESIQRKEPAKDDDVGRRMRTILASKTKRKQEYEAQRKQVCGFLKKLCMQKEDVKEDDLQKLWNGDKGDLDQDSSKAIYKLYSALRPLLKGVYSSSCKVSSQVPFCVLANLILKATGNQKHTRQLCPFSKPTTIHALTITPQTLFEMVIDLIPDTHKKGIKSVSAAKERADDTFGWIFDVEEINNSCQQRNLSFADRLKLTNSQIARIVCTVDDPERLTQTYNTPKYQPFIIPASKADLKRQLDTLEDERNQLQNTLSTKQPDYDTLYQEFAKKRYTIAKDFDTENPLHQSLQDGVKTMKVELKRKKYDIMCIEEDIRMNKRMKAVVQRSIDNNKSKKRKERDVTKVSIKNDRATCIAPANSIDLITLREENKELGFVGVDYGFHTLATSVPMMEERILYHHRLLQNEGEEQFIPLSRPINLYSGIVAAYTGEYKRRRKLITSKATTEKGKEVQGIEQELASNSYGSITTLSDLDKTHELHCSKRHTLRSFYHTKKTARLHRYGEFRKRLYKARILAQERQQLFKSLKWEHSKSAATNDLSKHTTMMIGASGMGYGSTIKGFFRFGGKWMREDHAKYLPVAIVDEYRTSQICPYCGHQITRPKTNNGKKSLGGAMCTNPYCVSVKAGRACNGRDIMAATNICLKGYSCIFNKPINQLDRNPVYQAKL